MSSKHKNEPSFDDLRKCLSNVFTHNIRGVQFCLFGSGGQEVDKGAVLTCEMRGRILSGRLPLLPRRRDPLREWQRFSITVAADKKDWTRKYCTRFDAHLVCFSACDTFQMVVSCAGRSWFCLTDADCHGHGHQGLPCPGSTDVLDDSCA